MTITSQMVKELREKTNAGMMDCKKALTETDGNMEKAVDLLRQKGLAVAAKRSGKEAKEGTIRSEEHTSELQSLSHLVCRLLLEKKKKLR